ncbi:hypothetical protein [Prosthecochloris sp.]|uniref:hypothetical protein n=1 Tax=Prosthecochloris sp. TaxID=290513 RepID=UPI0025E92A79|nr:hypothetical protein [Prosthecochloris sp.]
MAERRILLLLDGSISIMHESRSMMPKLPGFYGDRSFRQRFKQNVQRRKNIESMFFRRTGKPGFTHSISTVVFGYPVLSGNRILPTSLYCRDQETPVVSERRLMYH